MTNYRVYFEPSAKSGNFTEGRSLLDIARDLNIGLNNVCGGNGKCGQCIVRVMEGKVSPVTDSERKLLSPENLDDGYRLACRINIMGDVRISIPLRSLSALQRAQVEGLEANIPPEPVINSFPVTVSPPSLEDARADFERLQSAISSMHRAGPITADIMVLRSLSPELRKNKRNIIAEIRGSEVISLHPPTSRSLGLAVDLGTTKIAVYLIDLVTGQTLGARGIMNPQVLFGDDIIARIVAAIHSTDNAKKLSDLVIQAIDTAAGEMCTAINVQSYTILDAVIVGNTAMHHLLLSLPVEQLAKAPYIPAVSAALDIKARDLGLHFAPGAYVHFLPNIAGYVGADHTAMLLSTDLAKKNGITLALDIGTNTEICLAKNHVLTSVSCASGPAFEGARIKNGMRATSGAIEHIRISGENVEYQTVDGTPPQGICGSGIIDLTAQLYTAGIVDAGGRLLRHSRVRDNNGSREFVVIEASSDSPEITFTQKDIREIQLAKGAIKTGITVLLENSGLTVRDIDEVIIAGAFGTYMDTGSAVTIGMLPDLPEEHIRQVGNAAGMGAKIALISGSKRVEAQEIARSVRYIELAAAPGFSRIFADSMKFGK